MDLNLTKLNGSNNSSLLPSSSKGSFEYKYVSTTRTVLRNMWLFDFLEHFMLVMYEDRQATLKQIAEKAYEKGLAPHHPWIVRKAAQLGMLAVPHKETFMT